MSSETTREFRAATLKLSQGPDMPVLTARMPPRATAEEFGRTAKGAFDLISKLTGHRACRAASSSSSTTCSSAR